VANLEPLSNPEPALMAFSPDRKTKINNKEIAKIKLHTWTNDAQPRPQK
jgi:hypothetical protein